METYLENPYRQLNTYFLEVCTDFLYSKVHKTHRVAESGKEMYQNLRDQLPRIHGKSYEDIINESTFLSEQQKDYLLPKGEGINVVKLDPAMYIKISSLLEGKQKGKRCKYLIKARNIVSHISMKDLRGNGNQSKFKKDFKYLKKSFQYYGFKEQELDECYNKIFKKKRENENVRL